MPTPAVKKGTCALPIATLRSKLTYARIKPRISGAFSFHQDLLLFYPGNLPFRAHILHAP